MEELLVGRNSAEMKKALVGKVITIKPRDKRGKANTVTVETVSYRKADGTVNVNGESYALERIKISDTPAAGASLRAQYLAADDKGKAAILRSLREGDEPLS